MNFWEDLYDIEIDDLMVANRSKKSSSRLSYTSDDQGRGITLVMFLLRNCVRGYNDTSTSSDVFLNSLIEDRDRDRGHLGLKIKLQILEERIGFSIENILRDINLLKARDSDKKYCDPETRDPIDTQLLERTQKFFLEIKCKESSVEDLRKLIGKPPGIPAEQVEQDAIIMLQELIDSKGPSTWNLSNMANRIDRNRRELEPRY